MKQKLFLCGIFVAVMCVGLILSCASGSTMPPGLAIVSDSEAAQIMAGQPGSDFVWLSCGLAGGKLGCSGELGYRTHNAVNPGWHGTDQFPCGGSCGVQWQGFARYNQGG